MTVNEKQLAALEAELNEARLELAASREREARLEFENAWLLKGMAMLTRPRGIDSLFDALISILRPLIGFEHAVVLVQEEADAPLRCAMASHPALEHASWHSGSLFQRVLNGETVSLFNPVATREFADSSTEVKSLAGSALLTALQMNQGRMMLVCLHSSRYQLGLNAKSLLLRYRPLMDQALLNVIHLSQLEQRVAEKTLDLEKSRHCFRQFAEMASDWFWETDQDNCFIDIGLALGDEHLSNALQRRISGKRFTDYLSPREQAKHDKWLHYHQELAAHRSLRGFRFEVIYGEREHWLLINADPYFDNAGEFLGYRGTVNDITFQVLRNQELRRAKRRADEANQAKSQFLAVMSHEIRTPMQAILGLLDLLQQDQLSRQQRELIRHVSHSANLLQMLLHDVLDLSRIESQQMALEHIPFDLSFIVHSVMTQLSEQVRAKGLRLDISLDPRLPQQLMGDPMRLTQILFNLLGNAIKFTEQGRVSLAVHDGGDRISFDVVDTGIGIPVEKLGELFTPFQQLDPSMSRRYGGTGLGLAISRRLVELMQGSIDVESEEGRGSRFWFSLPKIEPISTPTVEPVALPRLHILLVEDSPLNQQVLSAILQRMGQKVTSAANGATALALARLDLPDLVLMDLRMPGMDGFETTRRLKQDFSELPILGLSADVSELDRAACLAAGMMTLIGKPATRESLHSALVDVCKQKKWPT